MPYITGTGQPQAVTSTCPRCKAVRLFTCTVPGLGFYLCGGCEWPFTFGAGTSPLATNNSTTTASTALPFASGGTQFLLGQTLFVSDAASSEIVVVSGTPTGTTVPVNGFLFNHASGKNVTVAVPSPTLSNQDKIPPAPGWGF